MRNKFKIITSLLLIAAVCFQSCEKEQDEELKSNSISTQNVRVKKVSYRDFKSNRKAVEGLKSAIVKRNPSLINSRTVYDEEFGVYVDTTNIVVNETPDSETITMSILSEEDLTQVENLILVLNDDGSYRAYIAEYDLTEDQLDAVSRGESIEGIFPTSITEIDDSSKISITGSCASTSYYTVHSCYNSNGDVMADNGELGNGCVGMSFDVTYEIITVDLSCLTSGGGTSGTDSTGGTGSSTGGTGGSTGGTGGSVGGGGSSGSYSIYDTIINTIFVPCTECIELTPELANFLEGLPPELIDFWSSLTDRQRDVFLAYLNQNDYSNESIEELKNILDIMDDGMVNGEPVLVAPDLPITDMTDYLSCFNTSEGATITIYADQPVSGEHTVYAPLMNVGHAFISIQQGSNVATLGFYPQCSPCSLMPNIATPDPTDFASVSGVFGNDEGHDFDVSLSVAIDSISLTNLIDGFISVANSSPLYNLGSNNCTDVAIMAFESTSAIDIPNSESPGPWNGQTPATLGEKLRDMETPAGGTKNETGGNASNNSCY